MKTNVSATVVACKVLGGIHLVSQTVADLCVKGEVSLRKEEEPIEVARERLTKTIIHQSKFGFESVQMQAAKEATRMLLISEI